MYQKITTRSLSALMGMLFVALAAFGPLSLEAANLHAIIVADTTDYSIGDSTAVDHDNMRKEMQKIALYTGLNLKETTVKGKEVVPEKVLDKLSKLKIENDDVVIFYFSGHGYRTPSKGESPWPNLFFSRVDKGIDYDDVGKKLEGYNPRLLIIIADVCNSMIPDAYAPPVVRKMFYKAWSENTLEKNYRKLFMDVKGVVMVTSSKAGEYSWGTDQGGLFTNAFLSNLGKEVKSSSDASWFTILDNAASEVQHSQHPDFRIFLDDAKVGG